MAPGIKAIGERTRLMERASFDTLTEIYLKESGRTINLTGALKWENQYKLKINENISLDSIYLK